MTHGSLFSGIGGFDLAAQWMGWENKFHCEWNPFGQKVLKHYWPDAELFTDITKSDFKKYNGTIDIISGGFPCQPYSSAGKRLGKEDDRHLWPHMLRAIQEIQPRWIVGENVLGLVNWSRGMVFHEVQTEMEAEGYKVQPFVLPSAGVNAPHRRDRIFFVAYSNNARINVGMRNNRERSKESSNWERNIRDKSWDIRDHGDVANANGIRLQQCENSGKMGEGQTEVCREGNQYTLQSTTTSEAGNATDTNCNGLHECNGEHEKQSSERWVDAFNDADKIFSTWGEFPTKSPICSGNDGIPDRLDGITFPKWRNESIKAYGNAVVPQVVYQIFKAIEQYEQLNKHNDTNL